MRISSLEALLKKKYCFLTSNCSTAIYILLKSLRLKKKVIIIPANICYDVVLSILFSGNIPYPLDIDKNLNLSFKELKKNQQRLKNIGAVILPLMYGNIPELIKIKRLCEKKNIHLIEDVAPALGATINKYYAGSFTDYSVCSFGQGKIIDRGAGGSLNINSRNLYIKAKDQYSKLYKSNSKSEFLYKSLNNLYNSIINKEKSKYFLAKNRIFKFKQAIINKKKFSSTFLNKINSDVKKINIINKARNEKAKLFKKNLISKYLISIDHKKSSVYWRKNFFVKNSRDKLIKFLISNNIYARKYYPSLNNVFPFIKKKYSLAENNEKKIINFWVGKESNLKNIKETAYLIKKFYRENVS